MLKVEGVASCIADDCVAIGTLVSRINIAGLIQQRCLLGANGWTRKGDSGVVTIKGRSTTITVPFRNASSISSIAAELTVLTGYVRKKWRAD
jgi:hypothetical protein